MRAAWWVLQPKDWLRLRLTGQAATDPTDASGTLLFDLARDAWADPLIEKLGLPREKLPPPSRRPTAVAGRCSGAGRRPRPARGIPVAVGAADTAAALFAAGLKRRRGHAEPRQRRPVGVVQEAGFRKPRHQPPNLYRAVGDGCYRLASVQNVGVTLDWVRNLLGATWDELYDTASRPRRADAPRFDPYLSPERWNPGRHRRLDRPHPRPRAGRPDAQRPRRRGRPAAPAPG